ncbi:pumilio homolog 23 [Punica granatum]|uniref:Pumilio homolog 23 n=1 Tax=Punica granatum TaxID=22663 RepID=A0A6P8D1B0_PUNGR|nr:pumilio homolog 23 [Punica granatum]XP_031387426.1 pumilio homolog 23 [Punica granatum]
MVSVGSKALPSRSRRINSFVEDSLMGEEDKLRKHGKWKKGLGRKDQKKGYGIDKDTFEKNASGRGGAKSHKPMKQEDVSISQPSIIRKQVDPETAKYFTEIANLFESNSVELEERSVICGNALEETRGKEYELTTDYIFSYTVQTLLEACDVHSLCGFLKSSAKVFPFISMDRSGSHVAETALKSLAVHLEDEETYSTIEETIRLICEVIIANPVDIMCNCYSSHVLRRLLCLCKGVSLDSPESHGTKSSAILAERLNLRASRADLNHMQTHGKEFPHLLKFLISKMLKCSKMDINTLQVDQYGSLVLQTVLKLLAGDDEELLKIIPIILGCNKENNKEGNFIEMGVVQDILNLVKETSSSHLIEVILEVAPEDLYDEVFHKIFRNSLYEIASHQCGSFVVQALVSNARSKEQMDIIWEELGTKFGDLLAMGRSGVIASLIAASHRLSTHEHKCSQALAAALCSENESPTCIVPRMLYLERYFCSHDPSKWEWPSGVKMHVMGSLILQAVFKYRNEYILPLVTSITSMEPNQVLEAARDAAGAHAIEAFLDSNASWKQKRKLIVKLQGHFGEISMHSSGSFIVEKCFTVSNLSMKETIVSELSAVSNELSKTKHGPHLTRKLDVNGYAARPEQWKKKQESKQSTFKEFFDIFGSGETRQCKDDSFVAKTSKQTSKATNLKQMRKEIDQSLNSGTPFLSKSSFKGHREKVGDGSKRKSKKQKR